MMQWKHNLLVYLISSSIWKTNSQYYMPTLTYARTGEESLYLWSTILILDLHRLLSWAMSSDNPTKFRSRLITPFKLAFSHLLPLLQYIRLIFLHLLSGVFALLILTCPNYLSLVSPILSSMGAAHILSIITSCLILYSLVKSHIYRIIFISATIDLWIWVFLIDQHSALYSKAGLTTVRCTLFQSYRDFLVT